jgi:hypothetical protein
MAQAVMPSAVMAKVVMGGAVMRGVVLRGAVLGRGRRLGEPVQPLPFPRRQLAWIPEPVQQPPHVIGLGGAGLTYLPGHRGAGPGHERHPLGRAEPAPGGILQPPEVVEHQLLGAGVHAPIIPQHHRVCRRFACTNAP